MHRRLIKLLIISLLVMLAAFFTKINFLIVFPFIFIGYYFHQLSNTFGFAATDEMDFPAFKLTPEIKNSAIFLILLIFFGIFLEFFVEPINGIALSNVYNDLLSVLLPMVAFMILFYHQKMYISPEKKFLLNCLIAFFLLTFVAELIWAVYDFQIGFTGEVLVGTYADLFWALSYIPAFIFLGYQMGNKGHTVKIEKLLFLICLTLLFSGGMILFFHSKFSIAELSDLEGSLNLFYPVIASLLFFLALFTLLTPEKSGVIVFFSLFALVITLSDFVYGLGDMAGITNVVVSLTGVMYSFSYSFLVLAAQSLGGGK